MFAYRDGLNIIFVQKRITTMKLKKLLPCLLAFAAIPALADATTASPRRVGPVSYYGALHTSGNKIIGAKNNQQAMLRGVSLFWSDATGMPYYNKNVIAWAAETMKIDVFRFAMGIEYYDSNGGTKNAMDASYSYKGAPDGYIGLVDQMVQAAIENDVYIIIDWHSHRAHLETALSKSFFQTISQKYKDVPNVIYEIYNEPVSGSGGDWGAIKNYANQVCPAIRNNTQNLILVGTPNWSQHPETGANDPVSSTNIAYVLHFYAATHSKGSYGGNVDAALNKGYPVFISEWGTTNADGDGEPNSSATNEWTSYMDQKMIPNCNWSLRQQTSNIDDKSEKSAIFSGNKPLINANELSSATYTSSGNLIKSYLTKNARSWPDSITKTTHTGSCAFKHTSAKQTESKLSGLLKSGCTYTSSNENVVTISGSDLVIKDYGFSILKGNDGSESVVSITQVAGQTIQNFQNVNCRNSGSCTTDNGSGRIVDYDQDGTKEFVLTPDTKTVEGASFTMKSLNPDIVDVKQAICKASSCSGTQKNKSVWMFAFKSYGEAKIVATAPAVTGYRAMQDTVTAIYRKGVHAMTSKFKSQTVQPGFAIADAVPDTTLEHQQITYTFNGEPTSIYLVKSGNHLVAGAQNALVRVRAKAPGTADIDSLDKTIIITVGDSLTAVNLNEFNGTDAIKPTASAPKNSIQAQISGSKLMFSVKNSGMVSVEVFDALGNRVLQHSDTYKAGSHTLKLDKLASGSYTLIIRQGSQSSSLRWTAK